MSEPKEFLLTVTMQDVQTAFAALAKLPWDVANPLIVKMNAQISEQMPKPAAVAASRAPRAAPPVPAEAVDDLDDVPPAPPLAKRRVQDEPDPLPRRRVNGRAETVDPDLAAAALAEPERGRV